MYRQEMWTGCSFRFAACRKQLPKRFGYFRISSYRLGTHCSVSLGVFFWMYFHISQRRPNDFMKWLPRFCLLRQPLQAGMKTKDVIKKSHIFCVHVGRSLVSGVGSDPSHNVRCRKFRSVSITCAQNGLAVCVVLMWIRKSRLWGP
jgi:hypothetical protein